MSGAEGAAPRCMSANAALVRVDTGMATDMASATGIGIGIEIGTGTGTGGKGAGRWDTLNRRKMGCARSGLERELSLGGEVEEARRGHSGRAFVLDRRESSGRKGGSAVCSDLLVERLCQAFVVAP